MNQPTMKHLKALAEEMGCEVEDDKDNATLYVHALNDKAWENGELSSLVHPYGSMGSYQPSWRQESIREAHERLTEIGRPQFDFIDA